MSVLLKIKNLSSGYNGKIVLQNISFSVSIGEVFVIIGQNGCGKSTLLKTIARITTDNSGEVYFEGLSLMKKHPWNLKELGISLFGQGGLVFSNMKVKEHFELALRGKSKIEATNIKEECLSYFPTLIKLMDKRGGNLSGGQRQMLSFSMILSQQTPCWLLDEPIAGLSEEAVKDAIDFINKMKQKKNKTIILVEHNYQAAFELADRVAIIKEGKIYDSFTKTEFQKENFLEAHLYN